MSIVYLLTCPVTDIRKCWACFSTLYLSESLWEELKVQGSKKEQTAADKHHITDFVDSKVLPYDLFQDWPYSRLVDSVWL